MPCFMESNSPFMFYLFTLIVTLSYLVTFHCEYSKIKVTKRVVKKYSTLEAKRSIDFLPPLRLQASHPFYVQQEKLFLYFALSTYWIYFPRFSESLDKILWCVIVLKLHCIFSYTSRKDTIFILCTKRWGMIISGVWPEKKSGVTCC